ncbi:Nad kinase [Mycena kentingensis (nom. inval.)]|nr:Nad kinase [Mycena kentingensis (nom. inval.)]
MSSSGSSSFSFSNNLVEIGALTALVGSAAAESLALGNRGIAGLAWAGSSSFGAVSVVKACLAGAAPGWLRESLGIRSAASDDALGFELPANSKFARWPVGGHIAVVYPRAKLEDGASPSSWANFTTTLMRAERICVYETDEYTRMRLREVPSVQSQSMLRVFSPADYAYSQPSSTTFQTVVYIASTAKLCEIYILWRLGAGVTTALTAIPWAFFFVGAIVIHIYDRHRSVTDCLDLVTGQLPSDPNPGGSRVVVLGASRDTRTQIAWRLFWAAGAVVTASSVVGTYISLSDASRNTVFIWAAFQIGLLLLRTLVHYALPAAIDPSRPVFRWGIGPGDHLREKPYACLPPDVKARVTNLALAVGQSQTLAHRRGRHHYLADSFSLSTVPLLRKNAAADDIYPLPNSPTQLPHSLQVIIHAIVGDTALSSASWLLGNRTPAQTEVSYSCVVVFDVPGAQSMLAIPSARVLGVTLVEALREKHRGDVESASASAQHTWWYWVPASDGRWLEFRLDGRYSLESRKERTVEAVVRTDEDLDSFLRTGTLRNSSGMRSMSEALETLATSRQGRDAFLELFG